MSNNRIASYWDKLLLAPMVRIGTLPMRLLALKYGADIAYCEEIIDVKIIQSKRIINEILNTIDYILSDGTVVFRTCPDESQKVVFQVGTSDAEKALRAAQFVEDDVAAIDVNMGCPKSFSVHAGMGAALLTQPEKIKKILTTLTQGIKKPVTCKIRILPKLKDTLELARLIESTGVAALTVHGRSKEERPRHPNHNDVIEAIAKEVQIPVIANGGSKEIKCYGDIKKFKECCGSCSVMLGRIAQWNVSIFRKEGFLPLDTVIKEYLEYSVLYDGCMQNVKYCVQQMMHEVLESARGKALLCAGTVREICGIWGMSDYYDAIMAERQEIAEKLSLSVGLSHKRHLEDGTPLYEMPVKFIRKDYSNTVTPKQILYEWTKKNDYEKPLYETEQHEVDKTFHTVVSTGGVKYTSLYWEKNKKYAEQAAAVVCLTSLGIHDGRLDKGLCSSRCNYTLAVHNQSAGRVGLSNGKQQQNQPRYEHFTEKHSKAPDGAKDNEKINKDNIEIIPTIDASNDHQNMENSV